MIKPLDPDIIKGIKRWMDESRLPGGMQCTDCSNYESWCKTVLGGSKPFDGLSRYCYFGKASEYYNVDFRAPGEFVKAMKRER